VNLVIVILN